MAEETNAEEAMLYVLILALIRNDLTSIQLFSS